MSDSGRKRSRKTKLVPRDCAEYNDDDSFLQSPAQKKSLLQKIKTEPKDDENSPDLPQFSVKVEVEDIHDAHADDDSSDYMKYLFSLSRESQAKRGKERKSTDSCIEPTSSRQSMDSTSDVDHEVDGTAFILDPVKMHKTLATLHKKFPNDKEAVAYTRNLWGKVFHEMGTSEHRFSDVDRKLLEILAEWKAWQLNSRSRESPFCYKCYVCPDAWWSYSDFRNHLRIHPTATLKLEIMHQECNIIAYEGSPPVVTDIYVDGKCFKCAKNFKQHQECKKGYTDSFYHCTRCKEKLQTCTALLKHAGYCESQRKEDTEDKNKLLSSHYPCKVCDVFFLTKPAQLEHLSVCHSVRSDEPIVTIFKTCRLCERNYFIYSYHVCTKKNIIHVCKYCHAKFQNKFQLELHMNESVIRHKCTKCGMYIDKLCMSAEHYASHNEHFQGMYRCLHCKKIRLYTSEYTARQHRLKSHKKAHSSRPNHDRIIIPKSLLEQCKMNPNVRPKTFKKLKIKSVKKVKSPRRSSVDNETDEEVDIETYDRENDSDPKNKDTKELDNAEHFEAICQITESIDIKPEIIVKEEKMSDDEDIKPDLNTFIVTKVTAGGTQNNTKSTESVTDTIETVHKPAVSTPIKEPVELTKVFKVSQSLLKPVTKPEERKAVFKVSESILTPVKEPEELKAVFKVSESILKPVKEPKELKAVFKVSESILKPVKEPKELKAVFKVSESILKPVKEPEEPKTVFKVSESILKPVKEPEDPKTVFKVSQSRLKPAKEAEKLNAVFKVSESILEPGEVKMEIKTEPDEFDDDLIILNTSIDSIKQESIDSENSELSLLNLEPEVILKAGYKKRKVYKCTKCDYSGFHREYKEHISNHCMVTPPVNSTKFDKKRELNYKCTKCNKGYACLKKYTLHFADHGYAYMTCPQCFLVFDSLTRLLPHLNNHIKNQFIRLQLIQNNSQQGKGFQCKTCNENIDMKNSFEHWERHLELAPETSENEQVTEINMSARGAYELERDALNKIIGLLQQRNLADNGLPQKVKTCFVCHRYFERQNDCKRHLIEHLLDDAHAKLVNTQILTCQICTDTFSKVDTYKKHMRDHASLPIYQCSLCNKTFSDSSNFTKHKKIHNLEAFICDLCNKKFQVKTTLERHMLMHMKTDPYTCVTCNRVFYDRSFFKRHVRVHHEKQRLRYKCIICRTKFDSLREKWDHMWEVHKQRKEKADCPVCKKSYRKISDVKKHCCEEHKLNMSLVNVFEFIRQFKNEGVSASAVKEDSDDDVLLIEEERETLVIYDDDS